MATDLIQIDAENPSAESIERAAACVRAGRVIAIPTEALYTIAADPYNLAAVGRVFAAKGREQNLALPMLVADALEAESLMKERTRRFQILARHFWPGPLTIITPASAKVPLKVTGNTGRLGVRQSKSRVVQAILQRLQHPLIATSANISGRPTCRSGIEVFGMMDGRVDLVLDGGLCSGTGATTIDIAEPYWRIIKQGSISEKELADVLQGC